MPENRTKVGLFVKDIEKEKKVIMMLCVNYWDIFYIIFNINPVVCPKTLFN